MIKKLLSFFLPVLLVGCNPSLPYWEKTSAPVEIELIIEAENTEEICGKAHSYGCFFREFKILVVKKNISPNMKKCILTHEKKHAMGYDHDNRPLDYIDCGDGTTWKN